MNEINANDRPDRESPPLSDWNATSEATTEVSLDPVNNPDDELLTAYLDGELSDDEKARLQKRLDAEPELAERYRKLQFAGRLVESLASAPINDRLTASTMEMLSAVVQKEIAAAEKRRFRQTLLWLALFFAAGVATFALGGWLAVHRFFPKPFPPEAPSSNEARPEAAFPAPGHAPKAPNAPFPERRRDFPPNQNDIRPRSIKQALPEELRGEDLGPVHQELFAFVKEKYGDQFPKIQKEEILYRFISERGVATFVERLSDKGKKYMEPLGDEQKIRLVGLLILAELYELRREKPGDRQRNQPRFPNGRKNREDGPPDKNAPASSEPSARSRPESSPNEPLAPNAGQGFYWKNESTGELAETLQKLPEQQRDELLRLPDEEMYAQLLILHWGFDPKQVNPAADLHRPGAPDFPNRDFRPDSDPRSDRFADGPARGDRDKKRPEPAESWNRFIESGQKEPAAPNENTAAPDK